MEMKLEEHPGPHVSCSCRQLKSAVQDIPSTAKLLYADYCHARCHCSVGVHVCTLVSGDVKASYAAGYLRKCLCLLLKQCTRQFPSTN